MEEKVSEAVKSGFSAICNRLAKLVDVKSIVTLACTGVFAALSVKGIIDGKDFLQVFLIIVGFYFGTQAQKRADSGGESNG